MANEIRVLDGDGVELHGGVLRYNVLFLFPVAAPKTVTPPGGAAANVVPTPAAGLPPVAVQATTAAERAALDAGTLMFRVVGIAKDPARTTPQLVADLRTAYGAALTEATRDYTARYQHVGALITAP